MSRSASRALNRAFQSYYETVDVESLKPPHALQREWGTIPFNGLMHRHQHTNSVLGDLADGVPPRHVYFSAAKYVHPMETPMGEKNWLGADLVFDLDGDHLPGVGEYTPHDELLEACKNELQGLLVLLEDDLGFEQLQVVFSGNRGYHVHVRDEHVQDLSSEERRKIVEYVQGEIQPGTVVDREQSSHGEAEDASVSRVIGSKGDWGQRAKVRCRAVSNAVQAGQKETVVRALVGIDGVDVEAAIAAVEAIEEHPSEFARGNIGVTPTTHEIGLKLIEHTIEETSAHIDAPVTTDTHRLIRAPTSLHGGSGLVVKPLDRDEVAEFNPLVDAVPDWDRVSGMPSSVSVEFTDGERVPAVSVAGVELDPVVGETVSVPAGAAVYAFAKELARPVDDGVFDG